MRTMLILAFVGICTPQLFGKISDPAPISDGTFEFRSHENVVEAWDKGGKLVWRQVVYSSIEPSEYNPSLERDLQWNIISSLKITGNTLIVKDSQGKIYFLKTATGQQVKPPLRPQAAQARPSSWPLALSLVCAVLFTLGVVWMVWRRGPLTSDR